MNLAEKFVADISHQTFLSLWSYPNPLGKGGKELCDLLVVCDPHIFLFSVKNIVVTPSGDLNLDAARWKKRAIEESAKQLYGAERFLKGATEIIARDGKTSISLPPKDKRKIFRIAVAIGREDRFEIEQGDMGNGFVHVLDENSFACILQELDTVTDVINYFTEKERFLSSATAIFSREEDVLGSYIINGNLPSVDKVFFEPDIWDSLMVHPQYIAKKELDRDSSLWDGIIETIIDTHEIADFTNVANRQQLEAVLRIIVKESRLSRRILSTGFKELIENQTATHEFPGRIVQSELAEGVTYVFMTGSSKDRDLRRKYLDMRCTVARSLYPNNPLVIGLATERYKKDGGYSFDYLYMEIPTWDDELQKEVDEIQETFGIFKQTKLQSRTTSEFPSMESH